MADITNIEKLLLGINYLGANGADGVKALWDSRFAAREAFLVDADPQENPKVIFQKFRELLIKDQIAVSGKECILTFFVDYTAELHDMTAAAVWNLKNVFETVLSCSVQAVLQFAYVGEKGLDETTVQRSNIRKALERNNEKGAYENYRLCMVGKSALQRQGNYHWKPSIVFLDMLRRCDSVQNVLPMTGNLGRNNVCFLRYGEFNENGYQKLLNEQKRLMALLANADSNKLRALVEKKRNEMVDAMEKAYCVDGSLHPQHPDMVVEDPSGLVMPWATNTRAAARRDRNPAYSNAQRKTRAAVEITGERMRKEITEWFDGHMEEAEQTLQNLFREADVGIKLKLNPVEMQSALYMPAYPDPGMMPKLALKYSETGVAEEIGTYLDYIKKNSISNGLKRYTAALQAAFEKIPQETFVIQKRELERELERISLALSEALDEEGFCKKVTLENPPESQFETNTEMNVKNAKFLLCRNAKLGVAEKVASLGSITVHSVDEHLCGIVSFDDAPLKAVMIESVECMDRVLDQLLPEVNYGF